MKNSREKSKESMLLVPEDFLQDISEKTGRILELLAEERDSNQSLGGYITEPEASRLLGRKTTWFWNLRKIGKLSFTKVGNKIFYNKADIIALLDSNRKGNSNV